MAERAGLENRRWGNSSASSNLAPSAIFQWVARHDADIPQWESHTVAIEVATFFWINSPSLFGITQYFI